MLAKVSVTPKLLAAVSLRVMQLVLGWVSEVEMTAKAPSTQ